MILSKDEVLKILGTVKDPEIDSVSVLDLGMIEKIEISGGTVKVAVLPTFSGCPALEIIKKNIEEAVLSLEAAEKAEVHFLRLPPWTSDRITPQGREKLKEFGIAPPPLDFSEDGMWQIECPYCSSPFTNLENIFGPTACRSILYCKSCKNPFEAMKPILKSM